MTLLGRRKRVFAKKRLVTVVLVAFGLVAYSGGSASAQDNTPVNPAPVGKLANTLPITGGGQVQPITPQEALSAASEPGAQVEVADGLTLKQAVGLETTAPARSTSADVAFAVVSCWSWAPWVQWGTWPYQQRVTNNFHWCAVYGDHITSWSEHVALSATLCGYSDAYGYRQVGGAGYGVVRVRAGGNFSCPTAVPWVTYHYNRWFDTSFYTRGSAAIVASS